MLLSSISSPTHARRAFKPWNPPQPDMPPTLLGTRQSREEMPDEPPTAQTIVEQNDDIKPVGLGPVVDIHMTSSKTVASPRNRPRRSWKAED